MNENERQQFNSVGFIVKFIVNLSHLSQVIVHGEEKWKDDDKKKRKYRTQFSWFVQSNGKWRKQNCTPIHITFNVIVKQTEHPLY